MKGKMKKFSLFMLVLVMALIITACGKDGGQLLKKMIPSRSCMLTLRNFRRDGYWGYHGGFK